MLRSKGLAYPCVCSRKDVEAAQSAPHEGDQLHYPGTCRDRFSSWNDACRFLNPSLAEGVATRIPCWRFRTPDEARIAFDDGFAGAPELYWMLQQSLSREEFLSNTLHLRKERNPLSLMA